MNYDFSVKKKRFVYKSVIGIQKNHQSDQKQDASIVQFPDNLSSVLSQPSKKLRLNLEEPVKKKHGNFDDIDFEDVDNDFDDLDIAEIDKIEILASQQPSTSKQITNSQETSNVDDMLDELLGFSSSKQKPKTLFLPSSKSFLNTSSANVISPSKLKNDLKTNKIFDKPKEFDTPKQQNNFINKNVEQSYIQQYNEAQRKANQYKTRLENIEKKFNSKDGEIKILREKLRKSSEDEHKMKEKILHLESSMKSQQSEKETNLLKELGRLKTQLEFKEKEVHDALEKQKQISRPKQAFQSRNRPNNISDGFKNTKADMQQSKFQKDMIASHSKSVSNQPTNQKYFPNIKLKSCFMRNFKNYSSNKEIVTKLSEQFVDFSFSHQQNAKYACTHNANEIVVKENTNELLLFVIDLQNSIELVEQDGFFVPNLILKLTQYLKKLETLFQSQAESKNENQNFYKQNYHKQKLKGSTPDTCIKCDSLYEIGFKSLFVLKESCIVYGSVRKYLLDGFARKQGNYNLMKNSSLDKKSELINGVEYFYKYPKSDCSILVQDIEKVVLKKDASTTTNQEFAVQLWETLFLLRQNKMWVAALESVFFEFYVHLVSHPGPSTSISSFLKHLAEKEILSCYLNVTTIDRVLSVLQLLLNCSAIKEVTMILCSNSERCPLLAVYNILLSIDCDDSKKMLFVFHKLVCLLHSLLAQEQIDAYPLLLESSCQCSNDVIECLITFLFDEFKILCRKVFHPLFDEIEKSDRERMVIFQSGISLLCKLCSNDKHLNEKRSAVEWSYFNLLTGTIRMYRKIPAISENEVIAIEDLLDQDQFLEFDGTNAGEEGDDEIRNDVNIVKTKN